MFEKYLKTYAEPEARLPELKAYLGGPWQNVLVIPAYGEAELLPRALDSIAAVNVNAGANALTIVVANSKTCDTPETQAQSQQTLADLLSRPCISARRIAADPPLHFVNSAGGDLLIVDRVSLPGRFAPKAGVGLARKIGCDIAAALIYAGKVRSSWLHTSDADVEFPADYFHIAKAKGVAAIYQYEHVPTDPTATSWEALQLYEISLRYYERGLAYAASPYAFQTIGSTIAVHHLAYAQVRGFPDRLAGEDFYILNKLAKVGPIIKNYGVTIKIRDRPSDRVPFGTGAAVTKISARLAAQSQFRLYPPQTFAILKIWLAACTEFLGHEDLDFLFGDFSRQVEEMPDALRAGHDGVRQVEEMPDALRAGHDGVARRAGHDGVALRAGHDGVARRAGHEVLKRMDASLNLSQGLEQVLSKSPELRHRQRHFHTWFDALKTLRFIHFWRDQLPANTDYVEALTQAHFLPHPELFRTRGLPENLAVMRH